MKPYLFIDYYQTLSFDHLWSDHLDSAIIGSTLFGSHNQALINDWMRGYYTAEAIVAHTAEQTGLDKESLWQSLVSSAKELTIVNETRPLIEQTKTKYNVVLFTDNFDTFTRFTVPNNPYYEVFDSIINSAEVGLLKCDEEGKSFLNVANEQIFESILIDDSESLKITFEALGGTVCKVGTPELTMAALARVISDL